MLEPTLIFTTHVSLCWANWAINLEATQVSKCTQTGKLLCVCAGTASPCRPSFCSFGSHQTCIISTTLLWDTILSWAFCKAFKCINIYVFYLWKEGVGKNPTPLLNIVIVVGGKKSIQREESCSIAFLIPRVAYGGHNGWTLALAY